MNFCWRCRDMQLGIYIYPEHCVECGHPFLGSARLEPVDVTQLAPDELRGPGDDGEVAEGGMQQNELPAAEEIQENEQPEARAEPNRAVELTLFGVFPGDLPEGADVECSICLMQFWDRAGPKIPVKITCGHIFHKKCIFDAFALTAKKCPLCRQLYKRS